MPAPKKPNTEAARAASLVSRAAAREAAKLDAAAKTLESAGWLVLRPFELAELTADHGEAYIASYMRATIKLRVAKLNP